MWTNYIGPHHGTKKGLMKNILYKVVMNYIIISLNSLGFADKKINKYSVPLFVAS